MNMHKKTYNDDARLDAHPPDHAGACSLSIFLHMHSHEDLNVQSNIYKHTYVFYISMMIDDARLDTNLSDNAGAHKAK